MYWKQQTTIGNYASESEGEQVLDSILASVPNDLVVFPQAIGQVIQPRHGTAQTTVQADRLVVPKRSAIDKGWDLGAVVIECKPPGEKLGPVVAQCIDYLRSAYELRASKVVVIPQYAFIWQTPSLISGDIASMMAQNRIGGMFLHHHVSIIEAKFCGRRVFELGPAELHGWQRPKCGNKTGRR